MKTWLTYRFFCFINNCQISLTHSLMDSSIQRFLILMSIEKSTFVMIIQKHGLRDLVVRHVVVQGLLWTRRFDFYYFRIFTLKTLRNLIILHQLFVTLFLALFQRFLFKICDDFDAWLVLEGGHGLLLRTFIHFWCVNLSIFVWPNFFAQIYYHVFCRLLGALTCTLNHTLSSLYLWVNFFLQRLFLLFFLLLMTTQYFWLEFHRRPIMYLVKNIFGTLNDVRFMVFEILLLNYLAVFFFRIHIILPQLKLVGVNFWKLVKYWIIKTLGLTLLNHLLLIEPLLVRQLLDMTLDFIYALSVIHHHILTI